MVLTTINSIDIDFPYEPYPAQIRYMSHVIDSLRSGQNALLESPTGTGKTLCLLCATLAWRATYVAALQVQSLPQTSSSPHPASALLKEAGLQPMKGNASALDVLIRPQENAQLACPRIVFSSRTHSQLSQAVAELKKTVYSPSMSILASRDLLCVNDIATNLSGSRLNAMCRRITAPSRRQCRYHLPVASNRSYENHSSKLVDKLYTQPPMDIEDLRAFGNRECACPWFLSRAAARDDACEILFLPYNYLLDRSARQSLDIDWSNDIVIIDEAHNLEGICSDSMSFDLSPSIRSACDAELSKLIEGSIRPGGLSIPALEGLTSTEKGLDSVIGSENRTLLEIRLMRSVMAAVELFIEQAELDRGKDRDASFTSFPGHQLRKVMEEAGGPTVETYELFLEMLERAMGIQAESVKLTDSDANAKAERTSSSSENSAIRVLETAIRVLFESSIGGEERCFRTVIQNSPTRGGNGRTLSYWCFKPSVAMKALKRLNLRCLLLTSGTLSPLDSFATELGLPFPVRLENPHVVTAPQIWAGIIRSAPEVNGMKGGRLTSAYFARGEHSSVDLGRTIIRISANVPDGLLVFYPSYAALYACVDVWKRLGPGADMTKPSIWEHLLRLKRIVVEERDSAKVSAAILAHRANVDARHGSILLAVCRGKVSEGIDFSDEYGRAVAITGLPYPSAMDPKIVLKREYADEESKRYAAEHGISGRAKGKHMILNGSQWYSVQALRAVNQAVGRAIRHRYDYGAILLCDERFQSVALQAQISQWIRPSLKVHSTFPVAELALEKFFVDAAASEFAKEGEQRRLEAKKRQKEVVATRRVEQEDTDAVVLAQNAIERFLPPPKTESQFFDQLLCFSDDIKAQEKKADANAVVKKVVNEEISATVLDLSAQGARGGLRDSGCTQVMGREGEASESGSVKRSAMFLARRGGREDGVHEDANHEGGSSKRMRVTQNGNHSRGGRGTEKLSEKIKNMFEKRDARRFLELFRGLLDAHSKIVEGVGPLQSTNELNGNHTRGREMIEQLVRLTREKAKRESGTPPMESFLQDVKVKIPVAFQDWYDESLRK